MRECRQTDRMGRLVDGRCDRAGADARVAALAAQQWGIVTLDELRACGLTERAVLGRVRRGLLHRVHHQVYAVGHPNPPREGHLHAAVKACGSDAVLSHLSAAELWGFYETERQRVPEVTVVGEGTRTHPGIRVHRTAALADRDRRRFKGIPVTSPARTLLDLAARLDGQPLRSAVHELRGPTESTSVRSARCSPVLVRAGAPGDWRQ
jgi:predicted transcriptional regulator of viral defense system